MAGFGDAIPHPMQALIGSTLTLAGASLVAVPFGFFASVPLFFVGIPLCTLGTLVPNDEDLSGVRSFLAAMMRIIGAVCLLLGCILTSILTMADLVALKHGQSYSPNSSELGATILFCVAAPALFALGDRIRAPSPVSETLLRSLYWFLHFPGTVVASKMVAAAGVPLTA
jgi:hypothetical protein